MPPAFIRMKLVFKPVAAAGTEHKGEFRRGGSPLIQKVSFILRRRFQSFRERWQEWQRTESRSFFNDRDDLVENPKVQSAEPSEGDADGMKELFAP